MSLTKEEILNQIWFSDKFIEEDTYTDDLVHAAMDEYALQEMGKFAEWLGSTSRFKLWYKDEIKWVNSTGEDPITTEELIQKYLNRNI